MPRHRCILPARLRSFRIAATVMPVTGHLWRAPSPIGQTGIGAFPPLHHAACEPALADIGHHNDHGGVAPGLLAAGGCASKPSDYATGGSEAARPCRVYAFVHLPRSPLRRHGGLDVRTDRGVARIRAAVTSVRRCGMVDGSRRGERSPHRCMDRRASQRSPAIGRTNRGVRAPSVDCGTQPSRPLAGGVSRSRRRVVGSTTTPV